MVIMDILGNRIVRFISAFPGRLPDQVQTGATHHGTVKLVRLLTG
jgi:hypothetical protein